MKNLINSIYLPITLSSNKYVDIVQNAMKENGITISGLKDCKSLKRLSKIDVANLNWFESRIDKKSLIDSLISYVVYSTILWVLKIFRIRIVATMHNAVTHDAYHKALCTRFFKKVLRKADAIVCMNKYTFALLDELGGERFVKKGCYIPHPSYYGAYKEFDHDTLNLPTDQFNLLFMGLIRPYKNIELILQIASELRDLPIHFYICGFAENEEYGKKLRELANTENTTVQLKFFEDSEMVEWIKRSDAVLLPYSNVSSLNSGAAVLAFSYGTTVIGTLNGTLKEFDKSLIYGYDYKTEKEHYEKLKSSILSAFEDYKTDKKKYSLKGLRLQEIVNKEWNSTELGKKYYELYSNLLLDRKER